jgi:prephenate dehydratase
MTAGRAPVLGFLGPRGTFSEVAARGFGEPLGAELVPFASIIGLIESLGQGRGSVDAAVVPIENSTEGSVGATLDSLVDHEQLVISAEVDLAIEQLLIARTTLPLDAIEQIYSHPQGIAQARRFLASELPGAGVVPISSTAEAVRVVSESDQPWAAIGSRRAAEFYRGVILRDDIQEQVNVTRFVLIERAGAEGPQLGPEASGTDSAMKTTVVFQGTGDSSPGWLVRCLSEFAFRGVNLSKIESRPLRGRLGHYRFFADLEGGTADPVVTEAIEGLRAHCSEVRVLGSYPVAAELR